jgi:hypothetical protein
MPAVVMGRARLSFAVGGVMLMTLLATSPFAAGEPPAFPALTGDAEPLRVAFNGDAGHVRLLLFIDPT